MSLGRLAVVAMCLFLVVEGCEGCKCSLGALSPTYEQPMLAGGLDDAGTRHIFNTDQAGNVLASGSGLAVGALTPFYPTLIGGLDDAGARHIFNTDQAGNLIVSGGAGGGLQDGGSYQFTNANVGTLTVSGDAGITGSVLVGGQLVVGTTDILAAVQDAGTGNTFTGIVSGPLVVDGGPLFVDGLAIVDGGLNVVYGVTSQTNVDTGNHWVGHGSAPTIASTIQGGIRPASSSVIGTDADGVILVVLDGGTILSEALATVTLSQAYGDAGVWNVICGQSSVTYETCGAIQWRCEQYQSSSSFYLVAEYNAFDPVQTFGYPAVVWDGGGAGQVCHIPYHTAGWSNL